MSVISLKTWRKRNGLAPYGRHHLALCDDYQLAIEGYCGHINFAVNWRNCISVKELVVAKLADFGITTDAVYYYDDEYSKGDHYRRIYIFWKGEK